MFSDSLKTGFKKSGTCQKNREIKIKAMWDAEAEVWIAVSDDVPGLVTEAETSDRLVRKLRILIPELLEANGLVRRGYLKKAKSEG